MMDLLKKRKSSVVLGLSLDGAKIEGALLRRTNGSVVLQKEFTSTLALDLLTNEPELVGRDIRNQLDERGIGKHPCVVCVPLEWALLTQVKLPPDLPEADMESFIQIESEKGFPMETDSLLIRRTISRLAGGDAYATLVAVAKDRIERLGQVCSAAGLTLAGVSFGITALHGFGDEASDQFVALHIGEKKVDLQINAKGGVAVLRSLGDLVEVKGEQHLEADQLLRELRITLGQLPAEVRSALKVLRVYGAQPAVARAMEELRPVVKNTGLRLEASPANLDTAFGLELRGCTNLSAGLYFALRHLSRQGGTFDFLPPKVTLWNQFTSRYSSKKLVWAVSSAGAVAAIVALLFLVQQVQMMQAMAQWDLIKDKVKDLENLQTKIRKYHAWYDDYPITLVILRSLTEAFPEDSSLTAKTIEVNSRSVVTCSGTARDNQVLLKALDRLRANREVSNVKVEQIRGKTPLQFTFNFQWLEGGKNEN